MVFHLCKYVYYVSYSATLICFIIGSDNETGAIWKFFQAGEYVDRADADVAWSLPTSLFRPVVHGPAGGWDEVKQIILAHG